MNVTAELLPGEYEKKHEADYYMRTDVQKATAFVVWLPDVTHENLGVHRIGWLPELENL